MNVIELNKFRHCSEAIIFVFVDLQVEYVSQGRAYYLEGAANCFANIRRLLSETRKLKLPIAHFRRITKTQFFNKETRFSNWIEEFKPRPDEMVFEREGFSCYTNNSFCEFLDQVRDPSIILAGLTGEHSCLATAIESSQRKHNLIYVDDASLSKPLGGASAFESHNFVTSIIGEFVRVAKTKEIFSEFNMESRKQLAAIS